MLSNFMDHQPFRSNTLSRPVESSNLYFGETAIFTKEQLNGGKCTAVKVGLILAVCLDVEINHCSVKMSAEIIQLNHTHPSTPLQLFFLLLLTLNPLSGAAYTIKTDSLWNFDELLAESKTSQTH